VLPLLNKMPSGVPFIENRLEGDRTFLVLNSDEEKALHPLAAQWPLHDEGFPAFRVCELLCATTGVAKTK
jgi:hypothetical protein